MKKLVVYFLMLIPIMTFGQLFPKVPDFKGKVAKVTEKRYGKIVISAKGDSGVFMPGRFSGWKYIYLFDKNSELIERVNTIDEIVNADYSYERDTIEDRQILREIVRINSKNQVGDYIEYENFINDKGQVEKVNFWSYDTQRNKKELYLVEMDTQYENNKLMAFTRYNVDEYGNFDTGESCNLIYDNSDRLIRIERKYIALDLKTVIYYSYNSKNLVEIYSVDYLVGLRDDINIQKQDIIYKYDRHGNWTKRYYVISGSRKAVESKRKVKYQ